MARIPVGLQMYTVRDAAARDFAGTLRQVVEMGYAGVEWAGYGGMSAEALRSLIDDLGLRSFGGHVGLDVLSADPLKEIEFHLALGSPTITLPWLAEKYRSEEGILDVAGVMNAAGAKCREHGLQLCYHNHDFEFQTIGERTLHALLFANTDPDLVMAEIDTYWVEYAGHSSADVIRSLTGRCPLIHVKDMAPGTRAFAEFGEGTLEWDSIITACEESGAQFYIIEQDVCARPPLESARTSIENARKRGML